MDNWKKYLPSKRFLIIGVVVLVFVIIFFGIRTIIKIEKKRIIEDPISFNKKTTIGEIIEKDTDGDGIKDWEETLWGTDPLKPITFDSPDAKYIEQKKLAGATDGGYNPDSKTAPLNETQKVAREIFTTALALNQSGAIDTTSAENIAESVSTYIKNYKSGEDYKYNVLMLAKDSNANTVKKYYTNITEILTKHTKQIDNSLYIINESTKNDDISILKEMDPIIKNNENTISVLLKMSVPANAGLMHLKLINNLNKLNQNEKDMAQLFKNPVISLAATTQYQENLLNMQESIQKLKTYFDKKGI